MRKSAFGDTVSFGKALVFIVKRYNIPVNMFVVHHSEFIVGLLCIFKPLMFPQ